MDEVAAKAWLVDTLDVSRETMERLEAFVALLCVEAGRQNLVSAASLAQIWTRHIVDSAQLALLSAKDPSAWLDLGSGAGLPGLVLAIIQPDRRHILVESRSLRWQWLIRAREVLDLDNVTIEPLPVERVSACLPGVITARAFAPLPKLFALAHRFSTEETLWLLPKGRSAADELASVRGTWHCDAHMEPSVTDPEASIIIARHVRPIQRRGK